MEENYENTFKQEISLFLFRQICEMYVLAFSV